MKIDLSATQKKLANGDFVGFKPANDHANPAAIKTCDVKLGITKSPPPPGA